MGCCSPANNMKEMPHSCPVIHKVHKVHKDRIKKIGMDSLVESGIVALLDYDDGGLVLQGH
jgi:hypothetical protein